jgi:hypothetical protein
MEKDKELDNKKPKEEEDENCRYCKVNKESIDGLCEVCYYKFKEF